MRTDERTTTATRAERFARGWSTALISVVVAAFSHVAGGGMQPGALGVVLALAFAVPVCIALAGVHLSSLRLAVAVGLSQVAFHLLFSLGASGTGGASSTGGHHTALVVTSLGEPAAVAATTMHMDGASMYAAHVLAAVVTVVALRWGEGTAWAIARRAVRRLAVARLLVAVPAPDTAPSPRRPVSDLAWVPPPGRRHLTALPRRGPPCPA